ncbi:MAG: hypothetical protein AABX05_01125 [Nanoarchaeota archaeon]
MANVNQMFVGLQEQFASLGRSISNFFAFVGNKLGNYARLTLAEKISFAAAMLGLVLILVSIALFMI